MLAGSLSRRLYRNPETQPLYLERLRRVLDVQWREEKLLAEIERERALVLPAFSRGRARTWSWWSRPSRGSGLSSELGAPWSSPTSARGPARLGSSPREEPCVDLVGDIEGLVWHHVRDDRVGQTFASGTSRFSGTLRARQVATQYRRRHGGLGYQLELEPPWPVVHLQVAGDDGIYYQCGSVSTLSTSSRERP